MGANVRKIGKNWYIDVCYEGKRKRKRVGPSKRTAQQYASKVSTDLITGKLFEISNNEQITLNDYSVRYLKEYSKVHKKPRSYQRDVVSIKALKSRLGNEYLNTLTLEKIEKYARDRADDPSPTRIGQKITGATINREIYCLSGVFKKAVREKLINANPVKGYCRQRENPRNESLSIEEIGKLLDIARPHIKRFIIIAITTGFRSFNIYNLRWEQIDLNSNKIHVDKSETKNEKDLYNPISNSLKLELLTTPEGKRKGYVLCKLNGEKYSRIDTAFHADLKKAGIDRKILIHDLRHTFGSQSTMAGVDPFTLKELMGHKHIQTTQRYVHLADEHKVKAIAQLDQRLNDNQHSKI